MKTRKSTTASIERQPFVRVSAHSASKPSAIRPLYRTIKPVRLSPRRGDGQNEHRQQQSPERSAVVCRGSNWGGGNSRTGFRPSLGQLPHLIGFSPKCNANHSRNIPARVRLPKNRILIQFARSTRAPNDKIPAVAHSEGDATLVAARLWKIQQLRQTPIFGLKIDFARRGTRGDGNTTLPNDLRSRGDFGASAKIPNRCYARPLPRRPAKNCDNNRPQRSPSTPPVTSAR